jgi:hypothetical protein
MLQALMTTSLQKLGLLLGFIGAQRSKSFNGGAGLFMLLAMTASGHRVAKRRKAKCPLRAVVSTGRCNTLSLSFCWGLNLKVLRPLPAIPKSPFSLP